MAVLGALASMVVLGALLAALGSDRGAASDAAPDARSRPTSTTTTVPTTTTIVVEHTTLPAGTSEVAIALPDLNEVRVRSTPPPGWDRTLTPVVTSTDPQPPRGGADRDRVALPSAERGIVGRSVTPDGWAFANPTAYTPPQPLVFGVVQRQGDWVEVRLPVRPNGTTGWVTTDDVDVRTTSLAVTVSLSERRLRVVESGAVVMDVPAGIGRPATPTPTGSFTVTDIVPSSNPAGGYGPVALALDGYSEAIDGFGSENGTSGPDATAPVLAIHGTNRPDSVGAAQSNGCPRLDNADVLRLAQLVPAGTPVQIWP